MISALVGAAALLLLGAGAIKAADPTRTAGALGALGWPSSTTLVRGGALVEAAIGAATLVIGGRVAAAGIALSYLGFAAFVVSALRSGAPVGTCGCFGRPDTPPRVLHAVVDGTLGVAAAAGVAVGTESLVDAGAAVIASAVALAAAGYIALTHRSGISDTDMSVSEAPARGRGHGAPLT